MKYAGAVRRFFALLIDSVVISFVVAILYRVFSFIVSQASTELGGSSMVLLSENNAALLGLALYTIRSLTKSGQTLGCKILHIKVVSKNGHAVTLKEAVIRQLMSYISGALLCIGYIWAFFNKEKQTWHDLVAGTIVIKS